MTLIFSCGTKPGQVGYIASYISRFLELSSSSFTIKIIFISQSHHLGRPKCQTPLPNLFRRRRSVIPIEHNAAEITRLRNQHDWLKGSIGKLVLAPVDFSKPNLRILDSATADGISLYC